MSANTTIEWADHTFNPWEGCQKVGPGCDHCYAEARNRRFNGGEAFNWGPGAPRRRTSEANWRQPVKWNAQAEREGRRFRVFCASLADVFDNEVDPAWRADLFRLIAATPNLDWLLLTKRIGNAWPMMLEVSKRCHGGEQPLENVWLGATVVNQAEADRDIPKLLAVPARVRFLSIEPMLGPIDLQKACTGSCPNGDCFRHGSGRRVVVDSENGGTLAECICSRLNGLHWVIAGGESGPHARPTHPDWFGSLRDQCSSAGVPLLFKQWGEWLPVCQQDEAFTTRLYRSNRKAALHEDQGALDDCYGRTCIVPYGVIHHDGTLHQPLEPMAFLVGTGAMTTFKVGKKAAGRLLDGVEHNAFPASQA
jgi:protein gp37